MDVAISPPQSPRWGWFMKSTNRALPQLAELVIVAIFGRLIGLTQPFVFQALVDKVLPMSKP